MNQNKNDLGETITWKKWIFLNYKLPADTTGFKASIYSELKKLGAVNIQKSMWIMPNNLENYFLMQNISRQIELNNGESFLMKSEFIVEGHEKRIVSLFNKLQNDRYQGFVGECVNYVNTLDTKIAGEKFTFTEMEEAEENYEKLVSERLKIESQNFVDSCQHEEALRLLEKSKGTYKKYSEMVYQKNVFE